MKILAFRFSAFGDVAMLVPVLKEFLTQNPQAEMVLVSRKNFSALFDGIERLTFKGVELENYKGVWGSLKLASELNREFSPNSIADFHEVLRTKIIRLFFWLIGKRVQKIDKGREDKKRLTQKNKVFKRLQNTPERYADVLRKLGFSLNLSHALPLNTTPKSGIGFAPFAHHQGKMLPLEKSFELLKLLAQKKQVFLFGGGENETAILRNWAQQLEHVNCIAGSASLREELQKIAGLEVMVSMDSANMHLASLVGTRCISVWGATHPYAGFLGYGQSEEDALAVENLSCRPCSVFGDQPCYRGDYACLHGIDIYKIAEKI